MLLNCVKFASDGADFSPFDSWYVCCFHAAEREGFMFVVCVVPTQGCL